MKPATELLEFISFCIGIYAEKHYLSGSKVAGLFEKNGILEYLSDNYKALKKRRSL